MDMSLWRRLALALSLLVLPAPWSGPALAADATAGASPDLHLSTSETPGETTVPGSSPVSERPAWSSARARDRHGRSG